MAQSVPVVVSPETPTPPKSSLSLAVVLGGMAACGPFAVDMYLSAFPDIGRELGVPVGRVQLTLSIFLAGLAVGQIFWGTLSDHFGRRLPLILGCLLYAVAGVCCALSPTIGVLIASRFAMGLGGSAGAVVSRAVVRDLFDENEAARFFSMMMIIGGIAPIIAPTIGSILLTWWSWRIVFWCVGGFGLLCAFAVGAVVTETLPRERRVRGHVMDVIRGYWSICTTGSFLSPALAMGLVSGVLFTYISTSPAMFIDHFGVSPRVFGLLFAVNAIGLYACGQLNRVLLARYTARAILAKASLIQTVAAVALFAVSAAHIGGLIAFSGILFFCIGSMSLIFPNATAIVMQPFGKRAGAASAVMGTLQFVTGALCSSLVGLLQNGSILPATATMAICAAASYIIFRFTTSRA